MSHTTDTIRGLKAPTSINALQCFPRFNKVFQRFSTSFTRHAAPLNANLRKSQPANFNAFNETGRGVCEFLKNALILPAVSTLPNTTGHITSKADACDDLVERVLPQQQQVGATKMIEY